MITPITFIGWLWVWRNASPMTLGQKLCSFAYALMRSFCDALMRGLSLSARLTVATEMPKSRAMSRIVIGDLSAMVFSYATKLVIIPECVMLLFAQNIKL